MNSFAKFALRMVIGKNLPHFKRRLVTYLGGLLIGLVVFAQDRTQIPAPDLLMPVPGMTDLAQPTKAEIEDGLTVSELLRVMLGALMIYASRFVSFLRARKLGIVADWLGPIIGRSFTSLFRSGLTVWAAMLSVLTGTAAMTPEQVEHSPVELLLAAVVSWIIASALSVFEDGRKTFNPISSSPSRAV